MSRVDPSNGLGSLLANTLDVGHVSVESIHLVWLMGCIEGPHLVRSRVGGSLKNKGVLAFAKTEQGLTWHEEAKTNAPVDTAPLGTSIFLRNRSVNVTIVLLSDLVLESLNVPTLFIRIVHTGSGCGRFRLVVKSVLRVDNHCLDCLSAAGDLVNAEPGQLNVVFPALITFRVGEA